MILSAFCLLTVPHRLDDHPLWQIGQRDGKPTEFDLAPGGYERYSADPVYIVGSSNDRDWSYVLPGPTDSWAANRAHRGDIFFGLSGVDANASLKLTIDLSDSHPTSPPRLNIVVNGQTAGQWRTPRGQGDNVILGNASTGKASHWTVEIPGRLLKNGNNSLSIENASGSWIVFDAVRLDGSDGLASTPIKNELIVRPVTQRQAILRTAKGPRQSVRFEVINIGPLTNGTLSVPGNAPRSLSLSPGQTIVEAEIAPVAKPQSLSVTVTTPQLQATQAVSVQPVRPWTVYLFAHSHVDIGYTDLQTKVLKMHERNLTDAIQVAKESASFPKDSQYRFNVESTWVLERFLQTASKAQKAAVIKALRQGTLNVSGGYANLLTGMMHPEELMRSYRFSRILQDQLGVPFETASQTDVPGVTWGDMTALNEAGIKNLVLMPNAGDRVGGVPFVWEDRPFYWQAPSGKDRVFVWQTAPYSVGTSASWDGNRDRIYRTNDPCARFIDPFIFKRLDDLVAKKYPYDLVALPWSFIDNSPIDGDVPRAAKAWNEKYVTPRVVLSSMTDACNALKKRYPKTIPTVKGDYTPYWEDGIGSSAYETALNRATANRLLQAETLFAMNRPSAYPAQDFLKAWRNVILYSEHTWGAYNSISEPDSDFVKGQWAIKRSFARTADQRSRKLLNQAYGSLLAGSLDVANTTSWSRTDLIKLTPEQSKVGDRVQDDRGKPLPSQRLKTGELAVLVRDLPPFSSRKLTVVPGTAYVEGRATVSGLTLRSDRYDLALDPVTGGIEKLVDRHLGKDLVQSGDRKLGQYLYLPGVDLKNLQTLSKPEIEVVEPGPLVATLRVTSAPTGTKGVRQDITLIAGLDEVRLDNAIDKLAVRTKEAVHFAFPLAVPQGQMRVDMAWAQVRPETDQIAGANRNWLTTQGYVDVSNPSFGVTCASIDAPLIEIGSITANLLGSVANPKSWIHHLPPTQTFYSWALNNHWHTNYKADQEGLLTFRYRLQGHGAFATDAASRLGIGARTPLVVSPASSHSAGSLLTLSDPSVLVTSLVPSDDGKALIVRLWSAASQPRRVRLNWRAQTVKAIWRTNLTEKPLERLGDVVTVPAGGVLTLRAER